MTILKKKKYFKAGLDADTDYELLDPEGWLNAENIRIFSTDAGAVNRIESISRNVEITNPYLPAGVNTCIGGCEDEGGNRILWANRNSNGDHAIFAYDGTTVYKVLLNAQVQEGLGFSLSSRVNDMHVINGILYFNDNLNPPRKLNIDAAIKLNHSGFITSQVAYTSQLEYDVISLIRRPPTVPPFINKNTSGSITINNIIDFAGQFAIRYVFRDGEVSVLSTPSKLANYNSITDTFNYVGVLLPLTEHISQDVIQVDFCVRYGNSGAFYIYKSYNRNVAADAALIVLHNAGTDPLDADFLNDRVGIALDLAYSVKPYDSVPLLAKSLAPAISRLLLANNLVGFNTPNLTSLAATLTTDTNHTPFQNPVFKQGGIYKIGIVFLDRYKRVIGNVITSDALKFPIPDRDYPATTYYKFIAWTLSNAAAASEIPIEAYYYSVVITKNLNTRFFIQAKAAATKYAVKDAITGAITYVDTFAADQYGLAFDMSYLLTEGMGYTFNPDGNDILKTYISGSATVYSLRIIGQDGQYVIAKLQTLGSLAVQPDIVVEINTPFRESDSDPFYTTGETYNIVSPGTGGRQYSALGNNLSGDVYLFNRAIPASSYVAENMSPAAKHWQEWLGNWGEVNYQIRSKQVRKVTAVQWTNTIIEGTQTNGLSTFEALNEKILPLEMGAINKLLLTSKVEEDGNVMLALSDEPVASMYLGETQLVGASGNAFVAQSIGVIGTVNILKGGYGTSHPESCFEHNGAAAWFCKRNSCFVEYNVNGLYPISEKKFTRVANLLANDLTAGQYVIGGVDPYHSEYLFSVPQTLSDPPKGYVNYLNNKDITAPGYNYELYPYPFDIYDGRAKTYMYKLKHDMWMGAMTISQEMFIRFGRNLFSLNAGKLYIHNQPGAAFLNGERFHSKLMYTNAPGGENTYVNLSYESNKIPFYVFIQTNEPFLQQSDLVQADFKQPHSISQAVIQRDLFSPNTVSSNPVIKQSQGDKMFGKALLTVVDYEFEVETAPLWLKFANFGYFVNSGQ